MDTRSYVSHVSPDTYLTHGGGTPIEIRGFGFLGGLDSTTNQNNQGGAGVVTELTPATTLQDRKLIKSALTSTPNLDNIKVFLERNFTYWYRGKWDLTNSKSLCTVLSVTDTVIKCNTTAIPQGEDFEFLKMGKYSGNVSVTTEV